MWIYKDIFALKFSRYSESILNHQHWEPKILQSLIPEVLQSNVTLGSLCSMSSCYMYTFLCRIVPGWQHQSSRPHWVARFPDPVLFSPWSSAPGQEQQPAKHGSCPAWQNTSILEGSLLLFQLSGEQDCYLCFRWPPMINISLSLPFSMTLNVGITSLPMDVGSRKDQSKQTSLCVQKGSG